MWPSTLAGSDASPTRTVPPGFGALATVPLVAAAPADAGTDVAAAGADVAGAGAAGAAAGADVGDAGAAGAPCPHAASSAAPLDKASSVNADRREMVACIRESPPQMNVVTTRRPGS